MLATCTLTQLSQNLTCLCIAIIGSDMAGCTSVWHAQITDREAPGTSYWYATTEDVEWVGGVPRIVAEPHVRTGKKSYQVPWGWLRPSTFALKEICAFQQCTDLLIPKKPFLR